MRYIKIPQARGESKPFLSIHIHSIRAKSYLMLGVVYVMVFCQKKLEFLIAFSSMPAALLVGTRRKKALFTWPKRYACLPSEE